MWFITSEPFVICVLNHFLGSFYPQASGSRPGFSRATEIDLLRGIVRTVPPRAGAATDAPLSSRITHQTLFAVNVAPAERPQTLFLDTRLF